MIPIFIIILHVTLLKNKYKYRKKFAKNITSQLHVD